jgi:hypothetical protein
LWTKHGWSCLYGDSYTSHPGRKSMQRCCEQNMAGPVSMVTVTHHTQAGSQCSGVVNKTWLVLSLWWQLHITPRQEVNAAVLWTKHGWSYLHVVDGRCGEFVPWGFNRLTLHRRIANNVSTALRPWIDSTSFNGPHSHAHMHRYTDAWPHLHTQKKNTCTHAQTHT